MFPPADLVIRVVPVDDVLELRRRVLRGGDPSATVTEPRDADGSARHVGGFLGPQLVACASLYAAAPPFSSTGSSMQLRWMAVNSIFQRQGVGSALLGHVEHMVSELGHEQIWATVRDSALEFYSASGWTVIDGSGFVSPPPLLLPHTTAFKVVRRDEPVAG